MTGKQGPEDLIVNGSGKVFHSYTSFLPTLNLLTYLLTYFSQRTRYQSPALFSL